MANQPPDYDPEDLALSLYDRLIEGYDLGDSTINLDDPVYDWPLDPNLFSQVIPKVSLDDLTSGTSCGNGAIDRMIATNRAILQEEYNAQRITAADYTKALIELIQTAVTAGTQFLLTKDQSYWDAIKSQLQAATMKIQYETARLQAKTQLAELKNQAATYALTKLKLASEDVGYAAARYNLENLAPIQIDTALAQKNQILGQIDLLNYQKNLVQEQIEVQRAQTKDTRTDGTTIVGAMGKQKELYSQQITSYQRDAEIKAARPFVDAWITQKTVDEGLLPPNGFTNTSLDQILTKLKTNNGLT